MTDLRDTILPKVEGVIVDKLFLEYHQNTPWAQAKVAAGLHLNPQAMAYMRREIDERKLREKLYQEQLNKDLSRGANKNDGQQKGPHAGQDEPHAQNIPDVQRGDQSHDAGHGAYLQRPPGEGRGGQSQGGSDSQGQQGEGADLPADAAPGASTGDSKLA